ncbi:hypothetical protein [Bacillus phage PM1]|uniref:Uncharacterized protein n=1 Tax=Bacillus phage PM1 TaxID=547228 RepID=M4ZQW5_9CAUD|nr:hypothetical protein K203_gp12 [Bacillus phage PM1]BAM99092.1 hypothetical protein [Bacillus phage PM1]
MDIHTFAFLFGPEEPKQHKPGDFDDIIRQMEEKLEFSKAELALLNHMNKPAG